MEEQPERRMRPSGPGKIQLPPTADGRLPTTEIADQQVGQLQQPQPLYGDHPQQAGYAGQVGQVGQHPGSHAGEYPGEGAAAGAERSKVGQLLSSSGSSSFYSGIVGGLLGGIVGLVIFLGLNALLSPGREARQIILAIVVPGMVALAVIGWPELAAGNVGAAVRRSGKAMLLAAAGGVLGLIIADWIFFTSGGGDASDQRARLVLVAGFTVVSGAVGFATGLDVSGRRGLIGLGGGLLGGLVAAAVLLRFGGTREMEPGSLVLAIPLGTLILGAAVGGAERLGRQVWIEIVDGAMAGREINLYRNPSTIGSSAGADVVLADHGVAPRHASIVRHGDVIWIDNLSDGLDTRVNQQPLNGRAQLGPNDLVRIGNSYLVVKSR